MLSKKRLVSWFLYSWLITLPVTIVAIYIAYQSIQRFITFGVRYDPYPASFTLPQLIHYEWDSLQLAIHAAIYRYTEKKTVFQSISLFASAADIAQLESHLPQSGYQYIKAAVLHKHQLIKAKIRYRGDFTYHWAWKKKSLRVKTTKNNLYHGLRRFNLLAPQFPEQLNNYLAYQLAGHLGLLVPRTELLRVYLNGEDQGIHVLVEQLGEMTLRYQHLMPSDIYRGELYGKDQFMDSGVQTLFSTASVWDKVAVNNHYAAGSKKPLEKLLALLQEPDSAVAHQQLSALLDMQAWARFSFFESLIQSWHYDKYHNWRLLYDPWKQKFVPIVWDPVGWAKGWFPSQEAKVHPWVINTKLHKMLFKNGDFLRARYQVEHEFFSTKESQQFLTFVDNTVDKMQQAIYTDPVLNTPDVATVNFALLGLKQSIRTVFRDLKRVSEKKGKASYQLSIKNSIDLFLSDRRVVQRVRLLFATPLHGIPQLSLTYGKRVFDVSARVALTPFTLQLNMQLLPGDYQLHLPQSIQARKLLSISLDYGDGWEMINLGKSQGRRVFSQAIDLLKKQQLNAEKWQIFYDNGRGFNEHQSQRIHHNINTNGYWQSILNIPKGLSALRVDLPINVNVLISDVSIAADGEVYPIALSDLHLHSLSLQDNTLITNKLSDPYFYFVLPSDFKQVQQLTLRFKVRQVPETIYQRINYGSVKQPIIWSGDVFLNGLTVIDSPLFIKPGTRILLAEQASLVINNRLQAIGTKQYPIQFITQNNQQKSWGAVVLQGKLANGSVLRYCKFARGSGVKHALFEYTGMLSLHNVHKVKISDCLFRDNTDVDDMVHIIYSDVMLQRNKFQSAFADALDVDISKIVVKDSMFINSGNDGIDLMGTEATVIGSVFQYSGDKGISVGEGSQLLAVDNILQDNVIGVQVKDRSIAALINQYFIANQTAIGAAKKNWHYGLGGVVALTKSVLQDNTVNLNIGKQSKAYLFDSMVDSRFSAKRVFAWDIDKVNLKAQSSVLFPSKVLAIPMLNDLLERPESVVANRVDLGRRGSSR